MPKGRTALLGAAIAFARSPRGQRVLADARRRLDTPQNRARAQQAAQTLTSTVRSRLGRKS